MLVSEKKKREKKKRNGGWVEKGKLTLGNLAPQRLVFYGFNHLLTLVRIIMGDCLRELVLGRKKQSVTQIWKRE